jgi:hypothetical protein
MTGNFIGECGQIQGSLSLVTDTVILSQALFPCREGAETGCRELQRGKAISIQFLQHNGHHLKALSLW